MAALKFIVQPGAEVAAYNSGNPKTVLQVTAPANQKVKLLGWGLFFDGVAVTQQPVFVQLILQSTAGTMSSVTPQPLHPAAETLQSTAQHTATVEPATDVVLDTIQVHPQSGYEMRYPKGHEIILGGGERLGLVVTSAADVNCIPKFICEE